MLPSPSYQSGNPEGTGGSYDSTMLLRADIRITRYMREEREELRISYFASDTIGIYSNREGGREGNKEEGR